MTDWLLPALAGFGTGILSAWGVGGGTLLLLLMTLFLGVDQTQAQGINLLYFLPTAGISLLEHRKNGYLDREVMRFVPTVSARIGVIRICDSRNDKITQITRPSASARRMMISSSLVSASTVARLSRM